jgi:hypothetical protein
VDIAVRVAGAAIELLVPALRGVEDERLHAALSALAEALELTLAAEGANEERRGAARDTLVRVASIARSRSSETSPGRRLPWWQRPRSR